MFCIFLFNIMFSRAEGKFANQIIPFFQPPFRTMSTHNHTSETPHWRQEYTESAASTHCTEKFNFHWPHVHQKRQPHTNRASWGTRVSSASHHFMPNDGSPFVTLAVDVQHCALLHRMFLADKHRKKTAFMWKLPVSHCKKLEDSVWRGVLHLCMLLSTSSQLMLEFQATILPHTLHVDTIVRSSGHVISSTTVEEEGYALYTTDQVSYTTTQSVHKECWW